MGAAVRAGGALWELGPPFASAGEVNITISTEAIKSEELCGNEEPVVPAQGRVDTVIKPLLVQVRWVMEEEGGMGAERPGGAAGGPHCRVLGAWDAGMALGIWGGGWSLLLTDPTMLLPTARGHPGGEGAQLPALPGR